MKVNDLNFIITIDSDCDLSMSACKKYDIIPLQTNYIIDYKTVKSPGEKAEYQMYYKKIRKGAQVLNEEANVYTYMSLWHQLLSLNKPIIHICSSFRKQNYQSAMLAKETISEQFPNVKINVVDSQNLSLGCGVLAIYASSLRKQEKSFDEILNWIEEYKLSINGIFASESCDKKPLKKKSVIKQIINLNLQEVSKTYSCLNQDNLISNEINNNIINPQEQILFICSNDDKKAQIQGEYIKKEFGFKDVFYSEMNPSLASKLCPNTIALFYFGKKRA